MQQLLANFVTRATCCTKTREVVEDPVSNEGAIGDLLRIGNVYVTVAIRVNEALLSEPLVSASEANVCLPIRIYEEIEVSFLRPFLEQLIGIADEIERFAPTVRKHDS